MNQTIAGLHRFVCRIALPALVAFAILAALPAQARDLVIYGEPTLKPMLTALGTLWHAKGNSAVHVFVAPTDLSFEQIAREARCDVIFALAGTVTDAAEKRELFDADSKVDAFRNSLVLVARAAAAANGDDLGAILSGKRLAIANPDRDVVGKYGLAALRGAGVAVDPAGKDVRVAESAAGVLQLLADGNADVGIVYATDAAAHPEFNIVAGLASAAYPPIAYVAAQAANADAGADSEGFIEFLSTPEAKAAIMSAGLTLSERATAQAQPGGRP